MNKYFLYKKIESKKLIKLLNLLPELSSVIDPKKPITVRITPNPYVCLIHSILASETSSADVDNMWSQLILYIGKITPKSVAKATTEQFEAAGINKIKIKIIRLVTCAILDKKLNLKKVKKFPLEKIYQTLLSYKGITLWMIDMLLIFCYEKDDILTLSDPGIKKGLEKIFDFQCLSTVNFNEIKRISSPYGTFVAFYAWKVVN